jgi:hypothetical protein
MITIAFCVEVSLFAIAGSVVFVHEARKSHAAVSLEAPARLPAADLKRFDPALVAPYGHEERHDG